MSLIVDGTLISTANPIKIDGVNVEKVVYDGVTVWELQKDISIGPGNYGNATVTGSAWSGSVSSINGDKDGASFTIGIQMDLSTYKTIQLTCGVRRCAATTDNGFGFRFRIRAGSESTTWKEMGVFNYYSTGKTEGTSTGSSLVSLDVSRISGSTVVYIDIKAYHHTNDLGRGNGNGEYIIHRVDFLT